MVGGRPTNQPKAGYEYLAAYMLGKVIQDLTEQFTKRWIYTYRRRDQMNEAARSNSQNVAEGYTGES
ncbi:four helix bundle protein, partial [candidate division WWE3 bacterium CG_4_9_14_3_um_filter_39_7]